MKGGITSGVIYPLAVCRLAETFKLRSVGGASAGAIAAAVTAAAELGRTSASEHGGGSGAGFDVLESMPKWLAANGANGRSNLFNLFQPADESRSLFQLATSLVGKRESGERVENGDEGPGRGRRVAGFLGKAIAVVFGALRAFWPAALAGAIPGFVLMWLIFVGADGWGRWLGVIASASVVVVGMTVVIAVAVAWAAHKGLKENLFGMCTGMPAASAASKGVGTPNSAAAPSVTEWLHERIQAAAGRTVADSAVTFADLWGCDERPKDPPVDLAIMTTNLTERRPERLPWGETDDRLYFDIADMRKLLPKGVVDQIATERAEHEDRKGRAMYRMPRSGHTPILLAARMSLSFPVLLSAVRLFAYEGASYVPLWFTDGGACSNFPVHFFDAPLPRRPTFALNLARFTRAQREVEDESKNIDLRDNNTEDNPWPRHEVAPPGLPGAVSFVSAIVNTARGWVDGSALSMPGYRDRIVTVFHTKKQGGMNLEMPEAVIERLTNRGLAVGDLLTQRYAGKSPGLTKAPGWENQRWVRYRSAIAAAETWLESFQNAYATPPNAYQTAYDDWLDFESGVKPDEFKWLCKAEADAARARTDQLMRLANTWFEGGFRFGESAPTPQPVLRSQRRL
nr:patatin-like phospholipase family protein [Aldersonia kunmingensis]